MRTLRLLAPIFLLVAAQPAQAQRATVTGVVLDSASGLPMQGVQITLIDLNISTVTDSEGTFRFYGLASGTHTVAARRVGYEAMGIKFRLNAVEARTAHIGTLRLTSTPVELDPIEVKADLVREYPQLEGFLRRMRTEQGTFLTDADIERENPHETSDLIRKLPGFSIGQSGQIVSNRGVGGMRSAVCMVQYYVNGVKLNAPTINVIQPMTIVGMEIYSGSATLPAIYRSQSNAQCGVIAVWTRHTRR